MDEDVDADDLADMPSMDPPTSRKDNMFTAEHITEIKRLFEDADKGGGLNMDEFCVAMGRLYHTVSEEDLRILYMKIDANCNGAVNLVELLTFVSNRATANINANVDVFPKPIKVVTVEHCHSVVGLFFRPFEDNVKNNIHSDILMDETMEYKKGQYLSITTNGIVSFWTDSFDLAYPLKLNKSKETLPFSHNKKVHVNDVVYIRELKEMAIATSDREVLFYSCFEFPKLFENRYSLLLGDSINVMDYWCDDTKAVLGCGDMKGFLYLFVSYNIQKYGLFNKKAYVKNSPHPTVYAAALLKATSKDFLCRKVHIFDGICSHVRFFPALNSFAVCGDTCRKMVTTRLPKSLSGEMFRNEFKSNGHDNFFTCVEYSNFSHRLVTGGSDGTLRVWLPNKSESFEKTVIGHVKPISHIVYNKRNKEVISLSRDKNIRVWQEDSWVCLQTIQVQGLRKDPISSLCFNMHNNELVIANSDIGAYLGRGTNVFEDMTTSHDKPLCDTLYHGLFKQVVSCCQNSVVTVWDIVTRKGIMQFKINPEQRGGPTVFTFDHLERRLITISTDLKVKFWNFNTGTELSALSFTMPHRATGIVCIKDRLFVCTQNSKIIFDLDMNEADSRTLEHDYLSNITSMSSHGETLFTASGNGNIVAWEASTAKALYWLNNTEGTGPHQLDADTRAQVASLSLWTGRGKDGRMWDSSISLTAEQTSPIITCLKTREAGAETATLLTCDTKYIYAWSTQSMLGKFKAVQSDSAVIATISTDSNDEILLAGDGAGNVYLWDIVQFGFKPQEAEELSPPLLGTWKAHMRGVVSVKCDPVTKNIITAGLDCNVKLWTNTGQNLCIFGKEEWDAGQDETKTEGTADKAGQEQAEADADEAGAFQMSDVSDAPGQAVVSVSTQYLMDLQQKVVEETSTTNITLTKNQQIQFQKLGKIEEGFQEILEELHKFEKSIDVTQKSKSKGQKGPKYVSKPCPEETPPATDPAAEKTPNPPQNSLTQYMKCKRLMMRAAPKK